MIIEDYGIKLDDNAVGYIEDLTYRVDELQANRTPIDKKLLKTIVKVVAAYAPHMSRRCCRCSNIAPFFENLESSGGDPNHTDFDWFTPFYDERIMCESCFND